MKSFFFIPASRLQNISKIRSLGPDNIIIDFEDAILAEEIDTYFEQLKALTNIESNWFRLPVRKGFKDELNLKYIEKFTSIGLKFVLPKLKTVSELLTICRAFQSINFIILIEHPRLLLEMRQALMNNMDALKNIIGLGIGSHDLTTILHAKHGKEQLDYPRKEVLYLAKAYDLLAIDIASMDIFDKSSFDEEIDYGKDNGYDAKFIIHPKQLLWFQKNIQNQQNSLVWARKVLQKLPKNYAGEDIAPFVLDKEVIEKPHAIKAMEIVKKHTNDK